MLHAFGVFVAPENVLNAGIGRLDAFDIELARSRGAVLKLVARCFRDQDRVSAYCLPGFVPTGHRYEGVKNEYNALTLESAFSEQQLFVGKGAGDKPTGCALLSDISALRYHYKYEYRKFGQNGLSFDTLLQMYVRHAYEGQVPESDFSEITEHYASAQARYWIGRIPLRYLQAAPRRHAPGVQVIEC